MEVACCVANWTIRRCYLEIYTIGWILLSCKLHDREDLAILLIALIVRNYYVGIINSTFSTHVRESFLRFFELLKNETIKVK